MSTKAPKQIKGKKQSSADAAAVSEMVKPPVETPRTGEKNVRVTREETFTEPLPLPEPAEDEPAATLADEPFCAACNDEGCDLCEPPLVFEPEPQPEPPKSDFEIILERAASDPAHKMMVFHLPNYEVDRRTDKAAELTYCTTLQPVTIDYLATVAHHFGGGHYLCELYAPGRGIVKRWHEAIKKAIVEPPAAAVAPVPEVLKPQNSKSEITRLREVAEDLREIKEIMGWDTPPPSPAAPAATATAIAPLDELLLRAAVDKPELRDQILDRVLGQAEGGGGGIIAEALKHPNEARALIKDLLGAVRSVFVPMNGNGGAGGQPAAEEPADDLDRTLNVVVDDLKKNKRVGRAADEIDALLSKRPDLVDTFNKLLALEPAALLGELARHSGENLHEYGHALSFIINLRDALQPPDVVEGEEVTA